MILVAAFEGGTDISIIYTAGISKQNSSTQITAMLSSTDLQSTQAGR